VSLAALALSAMLAIESPAAVPGETRDEATVRWAKIAHAVALVAEDPPTSWRWRGRLGELQLVRAVVTIAKHESHFALRVHDGRKRGGGAVCLMQLDPPTARKFGFEPEALVGLDDDSTFRCFYAGATILAKSRGLAEARCWGAAHWFAPTVAAYGSGAGCVPRGEWANGVAKRAATYDRTGRRKPLSTTALEILEAA
jgi:hypothetical protein